MLRPGGSPYFSPVDGHGESAHPSRSPTRSAISSWGCSMTPVLRLLPAIPYDQILIQTVNGIVTGMSLALIASGLTLSFGIMDVVNFAHGELFLFGAYMGVVVMAATARFVLSLLLATLTRGLI